MAREDLLQIELLQAKAVIAQQKIALEKTSMAELQRKHAVELHAQQKVLAAAGAEALSAKANVSSLWEAMCRVYNIDFSSVTYDDATGRINTHLSNNE